MPIARVQTPDGRVMKLEVPEGATNEQIQAFAAQQFKDLPAQSTPKSVTPSQAIPDIAKQTAEGVLGAGETALSLGTGIIAEPVAGLAGITQTLNPFAEEGAGARAVKATREALTFRPRTETGKETLSGLGETLAPVGQALTKAERFLGEETLKKTGSPALAAIAHSLPTAALEAIGLKGSKALTKVKEPSKRLIQKTLVEAAPDVEQIKKASRTLFRELDDSGVSINQTALQRLEKNIDDVVSKQGIDARVTPEAAGAVDAIKESIAKGQPVPTREIDTLRTIARNAVTATDPNKQRVGLAVLDEIDGFLDDLKPADINKGAQVSAQEVGKKYKAARALWGRAKRAEMLQDAIEMGSSRKAGIEKGIRNELNNLLNRKKSRKFLTSEDVKAIRKVTDGDFKQNFASLVGGMGLKPENSPSIFGSIVAGGGVGAIASTVPGLGGAVAPVAVGAITVGTVAKEVAKNITKNRAGFLKAVTAAGKDSEKIVKAYLQAVPKAKRNISDLSDLLVDPGLNLDDLQFIANETVKDAVNAAKFKRELLQASAALAPGATLENGDSNNEGQ